MRLYNGLPGPGPCEGCGFTTCRCKAELAERRAAARDEVVRAAQDLWKHATVIGHPVDEQARWMRLGTAVAALARLEGK